MGFRHGDGHESMVSGGLTGGGAAQGQTRGRGAEKETRATHR